MRQAIFTFSILSFLMIQSCSNRSDKVFSAFDELHYIILYEDGNEFELLYNGLNTAIGTYSLESDTIFLTYTENQFEEFDPNEKLTRTILIDKKSKRVKSVDDKMKFCANIDIDKRKIKN
jgi:hypothetical protein